MIRPACIGAALIVAALAPAAPPAADPAPVDVTAGWKLTQIGLVEQKRRFTDPLEASFADGRFTLKATAGMLFFKRSDDPDGIGFVYQTLEGDGTVSAKVTKFDKFHHWGGAGVMLRDGTKPLDRYLCAMLESKPPPKTADADAPHTQVASTRFRREVEPAGLGLLKTDEVKLPVWLRVERKGKSFTTAYSTDGTKWKDIKTVEFDTGPTLLAGITAWNRLGKTVIGTAEFEDVTVTPAKSGR